MPFQARDFLDGVDLRELALRTLGMSVSEYVELFRGSAMKRAKLAGLKRNASLVLGNTGTADDVPSISKAWVDGEPMLRGHLAWALGRIASPEARAFLEARLEDERDPTVIDEVKSALRT